MLPEEAREGNQETVRQEMVEVLATRDPAHLMEQRHLPEDKEGTDPTAITAAKMTVIVQGSRVAGEARPRDV